MNCTTNLFAFGGKGHEEAEKWRKLNIQEQVAINETETKKSKHIFIYTVHTPQYIEIVAKF